MTNPTTHRPPDMQADIHATLNASPHDSTVAYESEAARLKGVRVFAFGGIGFAGMTSEGEKSFRVLMAAPKDRAIALFIEVFQHGTPEAQAYALTGLQRLQPTLVQTYAAQVRKTNPEITTMRGCILSKEHMADVLEQLLQAQTGI